MYSGFDPNSVDKEAFLDAADEDAKYRELEEQKRQQATEQRAQMEAEDEQATAEIMDPRNKKNFGGVRGVAKELGSAVTGGLQDTASSIVTLPERAIDMFSGEMVEEGKTKEGYKPEWDDAFVNDEDPIETKTWWGGAIRGLVHFGSMAAAIVPAAKVTGIAAATAAWTGLARGAAIGAVSDLTSKYSQEENGLAILRDRYNFIDTPISTKDTDHPAMKTLKNVVEGMGIGMVFDGLSLAIGKGVRKVRGIDKKTKKPIIEDGIPEEVEKIALRAESRRGQIREKAIDQLASPEFGAYKNKPIANKWQAAPTSNGSAYDVRRQLRRTRTEWSAAEGSTDSLYTPVQLERTALTSGLAEEQLVGVMRNFMSDARVQQEIAAAKKANVPLSEVWEDSIITAQKIYEGRNTSDLSPQEFWSVLESDARLQGIDIWESNQVVAADLVIGSLLKEIRDQGIANRELYNIADLADVDGPAKAMYDKLIAGLTQIKLSKMTQSGSFRSLGAGKQSKRAIIDAVNEQVTESINAHQLAMKVAGSDANDDLFKAIHETISMSGEIHNLTDYDNFIRKKFRGGEFKKGGKQTGLMVKGLQKVYTNSILSGPKTPMRAIMGTGTASFLRPLSTALGAGLRGDGATMRASMAGFSAMIESIPEAFTLFKKNLNAYWAGDVSTIKSRYNIQTKGDEQWAMYTEWVENSGRATDADRGVFAIANAARAVNDNKFLTYSTKIMGATDDAFGLLLARAKGKERAMRKAMDLYNTGKVTEITPQLLKEYENRFYGQIMDADGNIVDDATLYAKREATLTNDLTGFVKSLDETFDKNPWAKPFFLFARTGLNGLELTAKHTPVFNMLVKENRAILKATADNLGDVMKYGINNADELANAKALIKGRMAIGSGMLMMANVHFMNGGLTGNGPADRQKRQVWIDAGWKPRSIKIGSAWVSYDSFEPFNLILSTIGDIGDASQLMGPEWTENQLQKVVVVFMQGLTSKSYIAGLQQFVDLFAGKPGQMSRIVAGLMNNTIPMSSARNELGKLFNPHMKEIGSGIGQSIRNRNLIFEHIAAREVPTKFDMLNGKPIRDWDFPTRMFNMISPFQVNLDQGPGRKLLFNSNYDLRQSTYSYNGIDFSDSPRVRSLFQKAIGDQNLERELDKLAKNKKIIASIQTMNADLRAGRREIDPMKAYHHNKMIKRLFDKAKKQAFAEIQNDPEVRKLKGEKIKRDITERQRLNETTNRQIQQIQKIRQLQN